MVIFKSFYISLSLFRYMLTLENRFGSAFNIGVLVENVITYSMLAHENIAVVVKLLNALGNSRLLDMILGALHNMKISVH